jgi:hypothetical protein
VNFGMQSRTSSLYSFHIQIFRTDKFHEAQNFFEANSRPASQLSPLLLWNSKVYYLVCKIQSPRPTLSWMYLVHTFTPNFRKSRFNINIGLPPTPTSHTGSLSFRFIE